MSIDSTDKISLKRTDEREFAFKMLYAAEFNDDPWEEQISHLDDEARKMVSEYVNRLATIYGTYKSQFDHLIEETLENWELSRIAVVDKVILRLALSEIFYFDDIPPEVSINEAIEMAKKFSTARSGKFINGLLDAIYRKLKKELDSGVQAGNIMNG